MNILVTGANGQLGNSLRDIAAQYPQHTFTFTDVQELDITDAAAISTMVDALQTDLIINCAAYTAVDKAESDIQLAHRLNAEAPGLLAKSAADCGAGIIHISTDYVFDGKAHTPYTEEQPTNPQSAYGSTKLAGEQAVIAANPRHIILRTAWLYSPYGNNFVKTMLRLGHERNQLGVVYDQVGTPTYAPDLARAIMAAADHIETTSGIFHYSNEGVISWYDFTKAIHRIAGITTCQVSPIRSEAYPTPAARPHYSVLDKAKIKQVLGIDVPYWEDSLRQCLDILLQADSNR